MTANDGGLYKLLIIGGGPAGVGIFIRAARTGVLARLLDPATHGDAQDVELSDRLNMKQKGVAIVHDGDTSTFGSGNLGKYIINSNTFARSLLSSVLDEKPELDPPESIKGTFLERAKDHESTKRLEATGNAPACLVDFGCFLQNVGASLRKDLDKQPDTSKCLLNSRATRFQRLESGVYRVDIVENGRKISLCTEHLVLAMGGKQELPASLEKNSACKSKLFLSENCLREDGFAQLRDHLFRAEGRKVCIVGGSHSSFSVAWLLLNKGKPHRSNSLTRSCAINGKKTCDSDSAQGNDPNDTRLPSNTSTVTPPVVDLKATSPTETDLSTVVAPLAVLNSKPTALTFQPRDITILHRSPIRCYYFTRKDAELDGADGSRVDRTGCVNTFTGLREDSKNLYKDIKAGKECRVRLFQVNPNGCQNLVSKAYDSAAAIVWCCGYTTRMLPAFDEQGSALKFHEDHGVIKLDLQARVQLQLPTKAITAAPNLYGVGLGFSLRSHVDEMGIETRADGVTVYHRRGATLVLAALFGARVFGHEASSFEEMVEKSDKCRKKKEYSSNDSEPSLLDRVKRLSRVSSTSPASASPSMRTPTKPVGAAAPLSCSSNGGGTGSPSIVPVASVAPHASLDTNEARRLSGKNVHMITITAPFEANNATPSTNPPVKMLLQRRRSSETLHSSRKTPGKTLDASKSAQQTHIAAGSRSNGGGSLSKAAICTGSRSTHLQQGLRFQYSNNE